MPRPQPEHGTGHPWAHPQSWPVRLGPVARGQSARPTGIFRRPDGQKHLFPEVGPRLRGMLPQQSPAARATSIGTAPDRHGRPRNDPRAECASACLDVRSARPCHTRLQSAERKAQQHGLRCLRAGAKDRGSRRAGRVPRDCVRPSSAPPGRCAGPDHDPKPGREMRSAQRPQTR